MTTVFSKNQRLSANNCGFYLVAFFLVFTLAVKAETIGDSESSDTNIISITDITYNYQLETKDQTVTDCVGTLDCSFIIPPKATRVIFARTRFHLIDPDLNKLIFSSKTHCSVTPTHVTKEKIRWGTYFKVYADLEDGTRVTSPIYSINDYIKPNDLDAILSYASVEDVEIDNVNLQVRNKSLYIESPETVSLSVFDLFGKQIFNGCIGQATVISLDSIGSPFIIVTYKTADFTKTKKLLVR